VGGPADPVADEAVPRELLKRRVAELERENSALRAELDRIQAEMRPHLEREEMLTQLAENVREVFWVTTPDKSQMLYITPAYAEVFGRSVEEIYARPAAFLDAIHPDDRERIRQQLPLQAEGKFDVEYRVVHTNGSIRYIWARAFPLRDSTGEVYRVVGISEDITRRVQAEQSRVASEEMLAYVVSNAPLMLFAIDRSGEITLSEGKALVERGFESGCFVGRSIYEWLAGRPDLVDHANRALAGEEFDILVPIEDRMFQATLSPLFDEAGQVTSAVCVATDVTQRHKAQQAARLERRRLEQSLKAHERDRRLVAYEIHDGVVQGVTGAKMHVEALMAQAAKAEPRLVEQLTNVRQLLGSTLAEGRRLISGLRPPIIDEQGVVAALDYLVDEIRTMSDCEVEFAEDVHFARSAPLFEGTIYRIVQEALFNVIRHSQAPRARVEVKQIKDRLEITVQDWGRGFDPDIVTEHNYGLAGIRERARMFRGQVHIETAPGCGTTLTVVLPLADFEPTTDLIGNDE
jgi:PAS domain S-box-containing protein